MLHRGVELHTRVILTQVIFQQLLKDRLEDTFIYSSCENLKEEEEEEAG